MRRVAGLLVATALVLAACGGGGESGTSSDPESDPADVSNEDAGIPPSTTDFEQVCGGGTVSGATEYSKGPGIHPLILFEGEDPEYEYTSMTLPEGWQSSAAFEKTELVGCLDRISEEKVNTCEDYEGDEGEEPFDVEVYGATYEITLYAATTGEEVASGEIESYKKDCPFLVFFEEDEEVQREYSDVADQVRGFVKDYVAP